MGGKHRQEGEEGKSFASMKAGRSNDNKSQTEQSLPLVHLPPFLPPSFPVSWYLLLGVDLSQWASTWVSLPSLHGNQRMHTKFFLKVFIGI